MVKLCVEESCFVNCSVVGCDLFYAVAREQTPRLVNYTRLYSLDLTII